METIICTCKTCRVNADKIGATFPLRASVPSRVLAAVNTPKGRHNLVRIAHAPGGLDAAVRANMGVVAL